MYRGLPTLENMKRFLKCLPDNMMKLSCVYFGPLEGVSDVSLVTGRAKAASLPAQKGLQNIVV